MALSAEAFGEDHEATQSKEIIPPMPKEGEIRKPAPGVFTGPDDDR